jgi:hypothetical protein
LQLFYVIQVPIDSFIDFVEVFLLLVNVGPLRVLLIAVPHAKLALQQVDVVAVVLFVAVITLHAAQDLLLQFLVDIELVFKFGDQLAVEIKPDVVLDLPSVCQILLPHVN